MFLIRCIRKIQETMDWLYNWNLLKYEKISYGEKLKIYGKLYVKGKGEITIGDNVILRSGLLTNPLGGMSQIMLVADNDSYIKICNNVGISNSCIRATSGGIRIEDNVLMGGDCKIYDSDFHSIPYAYRMQIPDTRVKTKPVLIKEGAWIGAHSIILKGVTIGKHSIVGAGSVITKNVPDGEVWAGNPARFLKRI